MKITKKVERWFTVPQDEDGAKLLIKHLSPAETQSIAGECSTQKFEFRGEGDEPVMIQNQNVGQLTEKLTMASVKGWEKIYDEDGKDLPFNPRNLRKAIKGIDGFINVVSEFRSQLSEELEKEKKDQEKN